MQIAVPSAPCAVRDAFATAIEDDRFRINQATPPARRIHRQLNKLEQMLAAYRFKPAYRETRAQAALTTNMSLRLVLCNTQKFANRQGIARQIR